MRQTPEQPIFCAGDKAVCIDSSGRQFGNLIEGKVYTILEVKRQECCGRVGVWTGTIHKPGGVCKCGAEDDNEKIFYNQNRFVPLDTNSQLEEAIFEALKGAKILDKL